jgi:hypothetical protein
MAVIELADIEIDGNWVMQATGEDAGERIGWILKILLDEVTTGLSQNLEDDLRKRTSELAKLDDSELRKLSQPKSTPTSSNQVMQLIGKLVNYGLMIGGAIAIIYFISTGEILGLS